MNEGKRRHYSRTVREVLYRRKGDLLLGFEGGPDLVLQLLQGFWVLEKQEGGACKKCGSGLGASNDATSICKSLFVASRITQENQLTEGWRWSSAVQKKYSKASQHLYGLAIHLGRNAKLGNVSLPSHPFS